MPTQYDFKNLTQTDTTNGVVRKIDVWGNLVNEDMFHETGMRATFDDHYETLDDRTADGMSSTKLSHQLMNSQGNRNMAPMCGFFIKGYCKFGDSCRNQHNSAALQTALHARQPVCIQGSCKSMSVCIVYAYGTCKYGDKCNFRHVRH